jgi:PIN domain nuclease of toxin-antitoxin system
MKVLLDTHIAIWAAEDNRNLSSAARAIINDPDAHLMVSHVSLWEIAIKHALRRRGPGAMPLSAQQAIEAFETMGFDLIPIRTAHILMLETLPRHHEDPFDRLLVATAFAEPYRLLTVDTRLAAYGPLVVQV